MQLPFNLNLCAEEEKDKWVAEIDLDPSFKVCQPDLRKYLIVIMVFWGWVPLTSPKEQLFLAFRQDLDSS